MPTTEGVFHDLIPDMGLAPNPQLLQPVDGEMGPVLRDVFEGKILKLKNGSQLQLGELVHQANSAGRHGILVFNAKPLHRPDWPDEVVVKLIWHPKSRKLEWELLNIIDDAIKHPEDLWVRDHLPTLLYQDIDNDVNISSRLAARIPNEYEERILSLQTFTMLKSISDPQSDEDGLRLTKAVSDTVKCHLWVSEAAQILHRDVTGLRNSMYRKNDKSELCGVLDDWDLAFPISEVHSGPTSAQRTGTHPYVAIELLENNPPPMHLNRHDLESFFYVLLHLVCDSKATEMWLWSTYSNPSLIIAAKRAIFLTPVHQHLLPHQQGTADCIIDLQRLFLYAFMPVLRGGPEVESPKNLITSSALLRILQKPPRAPRPAC